MKTFIQWTCSEKHGYEEIDSADWPLLTRKAPPAFDRKPVFDAQGLVVDFTGTPETIDDTEGWVYQVIVQGIPFSGDHIVVEDVGPTTVVTVWNDDDKDWSIGDFSAMEYILYPTIGEWTYPSGDGFVTHRGFFQEMTLYLGHDVQSRISGRDIPQSSGGDAIIKPYSKFVAPSNPIHGIWVLADLNDKLAAESYPKWREWL